MNLRGVVGKLNQRKTESIENLRQPFCPFKRRKIIPVFWVLEHWCQLLWKWENGIAPQKCILEQNSQLPTPLKFGSLVFWVSTEMENWCWPLWKMGKNDHSSPKRRNRAKLWFSKCRWKWTIDVGHYGKWEKWLVAPQKHVLEKNSQLLSPLKFGSLVFLSVDGNRKLVLAIMENWKNCCSSPKTCPRAKLPITESP